MLYSCFPVTIHHIHRWTIGLITEVPQVDAFGSALSPGDPPATALPASFEGKATIICHTVNKNIASASNPSNEVTYYTAEESLSNKEVKVINLSSQSLQLNSRHKLEYNYQLDRFIVPPKDEVESPVPFLVRLRGHRVPMGLISTVTDNTPSIPANFLVDKIPFSGGPSTGIVSIHDPERRWGGRDGREGLAVALANGEFRMISMDDEALFTEVEITQPLEYEDNTEDPSGLIGIKPRFGIGFGDYTNFYGPPNETGPPDTISPTLPQ